MIHNKFQIRDSSVAKLLKPNESARLVRFNWTSKVRFIVGQVRSRTVQSDWTSWRSCSARSFRYPFIESLSWSLMFWRAQRQERQSFALASNDRVLIDKIIKKRIDHAMVCFSGGRKSLLELQNGKDQGCNYQNEETIESDTRNTEGSRTCIVMARARCCERCRWGRLSCCRFVGTNPSRTINTIMDFFSTVSCRARVITRDRIWFIYVANANCFEMNFHDASAATTVLFLEDRRSWNGFVLGSERKRLNKHRESINVYIFPRSFRATLSPLKRPSLLTELKRLRKQTFTSWMAPETSWMASQTKFQRLRKLLVVGRLCKISSSGSETNFY